MRREREMNKLKSKIENQEDRIEFEKAVKDHRKMRKKAKKDKKKKEKRKYRDNKDKMSSESVSKDEDHGDDASPMQHDDDHVKPVHPDDNDHPEADTETASSMDKLKKIHDKIRKSQPSPSVDDAPMVRKPQRKLKNKKPLKSVTPPEVTGSEPEPAAPKPVSNNSTDDDSIKRAKEIIQDDKNKQSSLDSEVIDQAVKPFANIAGNTNLKDHIKKTVEETVKKEVDESMAKQSAACPL